MIEEEKVGNSQNNDNKEENRTYGLIMWGSMLATLFTAVAFIIPVVLWVVKKEDSNYVNEQGKEIINIIITMVIYSLIVSALMIVIIGFVLAPILYVFYIVIFIIGLIKGLNGELYLAPLTIRFVK